jgi:hypothetical protein
VTTPDQPQDTTPSIADAIVAGDLVVIAEFDHPLCDGSVLSGVRAVRDRQGNVHLVLGKALPSACLWVDLGTCSRHGTGARAQADPEAHMSRDRRRRVRLFNETVTVSEVLARDFGVPNAAPGRTVRCPRHDDRHPSLSVFPDDRRAMCHSAGCVLNGDGRGHDAWGLARLARQTSRQAGR